ncbi:hypothetical protein G6F32_014418 [Rhizopus arrhizus]|nr:hypothetical protein G6F32_014418 [Rhizopus arrhizus]
MRSFHDDALFLVGFGQQQVGIDLAVDVAHQAIQLIHRLLGRAAVARHGHPAGVNKDPALVGLMADDGRQHGGGDVVDGAHAQPCHHQVEEHWAVGVEPTLTTGHGSPAWRIASAQLTAAQRSCSAISAIASRLRQP